MKYTLPEIEELRDAVRTLSKWEDPSDFDPDHLIIDPLLVERKLITYMSNETTVKEVSDHIEMLKDQRAKRIKKEQEARVTIELGSYYIRKFTDYGDKYRQIGDLKFKLRTLVSEDKRREYTDQMNALDDEICKRFGKRRRYSHGRHF